MKEEIWVDSATHYEYKRKAEELQAKLDASTKAFAVITESNKRVQANLEKEKRDYSASEMLRFNADAKLDAAVISLDQKDNHYAVAIGQLSKRIQILETEFDWIKKLDTFSPEEAGDITTQVDGEKQMWMKVNHVYSIIDIALEGDDE
jgi:hypothetical protein